MLQFPKLYLLLSSVLVFSSCRISKYNHLNCDKEYLSLSPVIKSNSSSKFKTTIDVLKNHLTGILIVKQTDSLSKHIVFVTELGMKMFDFEVKNNEINSIYVFEPLNKPKLVDVLKRNFNNMLLLNLDTTICKECQSKGKTIYKVKKEKDKWFYTGPVNDSQYLNLNLQETFHKRKRTSKITYVYDREIRSYSQIKCKQYGLIKFYFELNLIPN